MPERDWKLIRKGCPFCARQLEHHALTVWCMGCGFGCNWEDWPAKKAEVLRRAGRSPEEYS